MPISVNIYYIVFGGKYIFILIIITFILLSSYFDNFLQISNMNFWLFIEFTVVRTTVQK